MEEKHEQRQIMMSSSNTSGKTILLTSAAGLIIGGPLLGLMGLVFATTTTLLLLASPLLILFSPLLFGAACVLGLAMLGFTVAGTMAVVGASMVAKVVRPMVSRLGGAEGGEDWAGFLHQKGRHGPYIDQDK